MTTRTIWLIIGAAIIVVIGYAFYSFNIETKKEVKWDGPQGKAKFDPYYITERFLKAKGLTVKRETTYTGINQYSNFSQYDTMFFSNQAKTLSQSQITALLTWVKSGGKIVINANKNFSSSGNKFITTDDDKKGLLQMAGIAVGKCRIDKFGKKYCPNRCEKSDATSNADDDNHSTQKKHSSRPAVRRTQADTSTNSKLPSQNEDEMISKELDKLLAISPPEADDDYSTIDADGKKLTRRDRKNIKEIFDHQGEAKTQGTQPAKCSGSVFANFSYGDGHIIVYQEYESRFQTNRYEFSHGVLHGNNATYLYYLLNLETKAEHVLWFERDNYTTAWTIIWRYGTYALLAALLLLLAWAWKSGKRFGPLIVTDERESLSLKRHLKAMGDFHVKHDSRHTLVARCYEQFDAAITRALPLAATLTKDDLATAIKEKTQLPLDKIHSVLDRCYPEDDAEFTQLIHTINEIRKRL